ncbi:hypothetical protein STENM327S_08450 [Streptomyces tendae]
MRVALRCHVDVAPDDLDPESFGTGIRSRRSNHASKHSVLASAMAILSSRTVIVALLPGCPDGRKQPRRTTIRTATWTGEDAHVPERDRDRTDHLVALARRHLDDDDGNVLGVYAHGSATSAGLRPHSDLDLLVVLARPTTYGHREGLTGELLGVSGGEGRPVELIAVVVPDEVRPWLYPPRRESCTASGCATPTNAAPSRSRRTTPTWPRS